MYFTNVLNAIEMAYSYLFARGYKQYSVALEDFTLTVSKEAISLKAIGEEVLLLNRGYYRLSTAVELIVEAVYS